MFDVPQDFLQPEPCNVPAKLPAGFFFGFLVYCRIRFFRIGARFRNSLLMPFFCLEPSTVLRVFDGVMLWHSGAHRQEGTGGVRTGMGANCANHGD